MSNFFSRKFVKTKFLRGEFSLGVVFRGKEFSMREVFRRGKFLYDFGVVLRGESSYGGWEFPGCQAGGKCQSWHIKMDYSRDQLAVCTLLHANTRSGTTKFSQLSSNICCPRD